MSGEAGGHQERGILEPSGDSVFERERAVMVSVLLSQVQSSER